MRVVSYIHSLSDKEEVKNIVKYSKEHGWNIQKKYTEFDQLYQDGLKNEFELVVLNSIFHTGKSLKETKNALVEIFHRAGIGFAIVENDYCSLNQSYLEAKKYMNELTDLKRIKMKSMMDQLGQDEYKKVMNQFYYRKQLAIQIDNRLKKVNVGEINKESNERLKKLCLELSSLEKEKMYFYSHSKLEEMNLIIEKETVVEKSIINLIDSIIEIEKIYSKENPWLVLFMKEESIYSCISKMKLNPLSVSFKHENWLQKYPKEWRNEYGTKE